MPLSWSMDKIGPICRSIEDCALVFAAIHGRDDRDPTAVDAPFRWPAKTRPDIRVGYVEKEGAVADRPVLAALADLGYKLAPIALPQDLPVWEMTLILNTEAATVFDTFTKAGETEGLNRWPPIFRAAQFTPAIEYLRANRVRSQLMHRMEELFRDVDLYVDGNDLGITNLTGHPTAVFPTALVERRGHQQPGSTTLTGRLFGEEMLLAVARQVQLALGDHLKRPEPPLAKDESPAEDDADPKKPKGDAPPNREGAGK